MEQLRARRDFRRAGGTIHLEYDRPMKKSIGDNMIPKDWGFERGLELVKRAGFDGIELWLGDVPWFQMTTTDAQVRELRRRVESAGLVVSNVSTGLHWATPLSARDPGVRNQAARIVERQIETAGLLGTDAILVVAGLVTEEVPYNEVYQRCVDALKPLGEKAARAGGFLTQRLQGIDAALIDLIVRHFLRHEPGDDQDRIRAEQSRGLDLAFHDARRLVPDAGIARGQGRCPVQSRRDVGDDETSAFDSPPQLPHLRIGGGHLKPRDIPQPQLDAVEPGALHELEAALESPVLRDHVVADRFLH